MTDYIYNFFRNGVGNDDGFCVGRGVGALLGLDDGRAVGTTDGTTVGTDVGTVVGTGDGSGVGLHRERPRAIESDRAEGSGSVLE